jgi:hypothetical protein
MDNFLPFFGAFSVLFFFLIGGLWLAWMVLWILVPFTLFNIRKQVDRQAMLAERIDKQLGELLQIARALQPPPPAIAAPPADLSARYQPPSGS